MTRTATELTEDDYDALYKVVKEELPRVRRSLFPEILAQVGAKSG
jgi:hypothetical protein